MSIFVRNCWRALAVLTAARYTRPMTKAYAYLRVSGKSQIEGDGFTRQLEKINAYATGKGIEIAGEYREKGVSGDKELANREALAALLAAVESNGVKTVIVERADRLARDLIVSELILQDFRRAGVAVIEASSGENLADGSADPSRDLIRHILGAIAQYDKRVTVLKLQAARQRIRRSGQRCEGRKPFGHREGEPAALRRLQTLRAAGLTLRAIAQALNAEAIPSRSGKPWKAGTVHALLKRTAA